MFLDYLTSKGAVEQVHGSDTRLNVSSRSDDRSFYISRDEGQYYCLHVEDDDAATNDLLAYLRNDSSSKSVFIRDIHISVESAATIKLAYGNATAATGGSALTPVNMNRASSNAADITARGNGAITGVTADTFFSAFRIGAGETFEYDVTIILGQNDNIVVELDVIASTPQDVEIDIFFYLDTLE